MAYQAEISRSNPSCFLLLIDRSGSMSDVIDPTDVRQLATPLEQDGKLYTHEARGMTKADGVADAVNRLLQDLTLKCAKDEGVRDYYEVGVIGYGAKTGPALGGTLAGRELVPLSELADAPARMEDRTKKVPDGAGGLVDLPIRFAVWFDPVANGGTPMCAALDQATDILSNWVERHQSSFPPVVIHITDGESTDGDPLSRMEDLRRLSTSDGELLLFNLNISATPGARPISFPSSDSELPDDYARMLFAGASPLTPFMLQVANEEHGLGLSSGAKGFVLNGDLTLIIQALDIGTRPSNLR